MAHETLLSVMLTAPQVAEILGVPLHRVYELARLGVLPHTRILRQVRFDPDRLREWIDRGGDSGKDGDGAA